MPKIMHNFNHSGITVVLYAWILVVRYSFKPKSVVRFSSIKSNFLVTAACMKVNVFERYISTEYLGLVANFEFFLWQLFLYLYVRLNMGPC